MRRASLLAAISCTCALLACGDDDDEKSDRGRAPAKSSVQRCVDSWNAAANQGHQSSLAGAVAAVGLEAGETFRVGTWTKAERRVPVWSTRDAFADRPSGRAMVARGSCVITVPISREGEAIFFESQGRWQFVRNSTGSRFPADARRALAHAREADADALGKLKLR